MGFGKKLRHAVKHVTHVPAQVVHEVTHAAKNVVHETSKAAEQVGQVLEKSVKEVAKGGGKIVNAPKKIIHAMVKEKVNAAFEKKMLEAIDNVEKELGERKAQDKAAIDQAIAEKIKQSAEVYKNLTSQNALQEAELELMDMLRTIIAGIHDCRFGFKDSVEDILNLENDDYRVIEFLKKRPLCLALQNLVNHQNAEALTVLLPYFEKNLANLSQENKNDYLFLKHYFEITANKNETGEYFSRLIQMLLSGSKDGLLKIASNDIVMLDKNNNIILRSSEYAQQTNNASTANIFSKLNISNESTTLIPDKENNDAMKMYQWPSDNNLINYRELNTGYNWTPLHVAVHHGDLTLAKHLLDHGALILKDNRGRFPYEVPLWDQCANQLEKYNEAKALIQNVSEQGHNVSKYVWPAGHDLLSDPNVRETTTGHNWTPLHVAVHHGDWQTVQALLDHGALISKDQGGFFPHEVHLWSQYANSPEGFNKAKTLIQDAIQQGHTVTNESLRKRYC